jgi:hypothetical protein
MKEFVDAAKHKQQATINYRYSRLTLWWEEAAEDGGGTSKSTIVDIFEPKVAEVVKNGEKGRWKKCGQQEIENLIT